MTPNQIRAHNEQVAMYFLAVLDNQRGNFCESIARKIRGGNAPTGRAATIVCEIVARKCGGYEGSEAYKSKFAEAERNLERIKTQLRSAI